MSQPLNRGRIVLIEDNAPIERLVRIILVGAGFAFESASSGSEGIELAEKTNPDLILCDLDLPDMDGFEVLQKIRNRNAIRDAKVVAFTVFAMDGDRQRIEEAGFDGYIAKPLEPEDFLWDVTALVRS